ncbi:polysaccharide biosynthesis/export family protein [Elusimicrobiota bacterium]
MKFKVLLSVFLLIAVFSGLSSAQENIKINAGDEIEVFIWNNPELSREVTVKMDGNISMPLVGKIQAQGFTIEELKGILEDSFSEYIKRPQISTIYLKQSEWVVYAFGEVGHPGEYDYYKDMKLMELCVKANTFKDTSKISRILIIRDKGNGMKEQIKVNLKKILKGQQPDVKLEMGDAVYVTKTSIGGWNFFISNVLPSIQFITTIVAILALS